MTQGRIMKRPTAGGSLQGPQYDHSGKTTGLTAGITAGISTGITTGITTGTCHET
jgi:hypothetical protein